MQPLLPFLLAAALPAAAHAQEPAATQEPHGSLAWYLPDEVAYDAAIPTPLDIMGMEVGQWHVRHDQLVEWYRTLSEASPRMSLETYARTHENRRLLLATVSSPENLERIDEIREAHTQAVLAGDEDYDGPLVVWMGYGVHGNESSASNASLLLAYHLAAATGPEFEAFLERTVVLIDPCVNPDGLNRFAHWANMHKGKQLVADSAHREHREVWPGGRTNHYWFDLNRDWLLLTHPESRGRLARFHAWMPSVLTDYHEMGTSSSYFFQPGIPSRQNPHTPAQNLDLTRAIAAFHAEALDVLGSLYYTEQSFDDFYYGKGSTYPDLQGCIGILFEQASSRGHLAENDWGELSFPFTIRNQFTTSLSTLKAADNLRADLGAYQRGFFREARREASEHPVQAYVFGAAEDQGRTRELADRLARHSIEVYRLANTLEPAAEGENAFDAESSYVVPLDQAQHRLVRALFETRTSWDDNTFYDVSSWTFPLSFGVPYRALEGEDYAPELRGEPFAAEPVAAGAMPADLLPVAWMFEWSEEAAPAALQHLLDAGLRPQVTTLPMTAVTAGGERVVPLGSIVVHAGVQEAAPEDVRARLAEVAALGLDVHAILSGLTPSGIDLGSGSIRTIQPLSIALVVGSGVSAYEAGEAWHFLDQRVGAAVTLLERDSLGRADLSRYTSLILVGGASSGLDEDVEADLRSWVRAGGVLVATKSSALWAAEHLLGGNADSDAEEEDAEDDASEPRTPPSYADYEDLRAVHRIAGTIFEARLDLTHPLCFGYTRDTLPVFRNFERALPEGDDPFGTPLRYTPEPLLSGYASEKNVEKLAGTPAIRAGRVGSGSVICMVDNPNFRGAWWGTSKLFANALYFGSTLKRTGPLGDRSEEEAAAY